MKNEKIKMIKEALKGKRKFLYYSLFTFHFSLLLSSCKKQTTTSPGTSLDVVKVYNDSTISGPDDIIAGNNTLLMSYWTYNTATQISGSTVLATDNKGTPLWKNVFSGNMVIFNMMTQESGSYTYLGFKVSSLYYPDESSYLYMYNVSSSGQIVDSIRIRTPFRNSAIYLALGTNIMQAIDGNNLIYGYYYDSPDANNNYHSFIMETDHSGNVLWSNQYYFPQKNTTEETQLTDGVITPDGGYMFCGYVTCTTSKFFLMKTDANGDTLWTKFYTSGIYDSAASAVNPYAAGTSSLIPLNNGNYMLFTGPSPEGQYSSVNQSGVIYTLSPSGDILNSIPINYNSINYPQWAVKENNGNVFAIVNLTDGLESTGGVFLQQNTSYLTISQGLSILSQGYFQTLYTDNFETVCLTSDGNIACFGMIQTEAKNYYKPELLITSGQ